MIISKAQGSSLNEAGTVLREQCFLYIWLAQMLVPTGKKKQR
jgi:hypothetical protein